MDILHQITIGNTTVAVGRHQGMEIDPMQRASDQENSILSQLSPRKRTEWLASRELLFRIANLPERVECLYDHFGKPYLKGIPKNISVSHSETWCSAMISDQSCGVDIQVYSDTVQRISNRFLSASEWPVIENQQHVLPYLHLYWGAKECMYKAYGRRKLEFRSHLHVHTLDKECCKAIGEINYENIHLTYDIHYRFLPEASWVFCLQRPDPKSPDQSRL